MNISITPAAPPHRVSPADVGRIVLATIGGLAAALALALLVQALAQIVPDVLKAASGDAIIKPANGDIISKGLETVNGNALWIMATGIGTAITIVGVAVAFGVQNASNWAFRLAGGILLVFVVGPAVVA